MFVQVFGGWLLLTARGRNRFRPRMTTSQPLDSEPRTFNRPYFRSASNAYWGQVGVNRHEGGVSGEMHN